MLKYRKKILNEIKSLLSYFIEFSNDKSILPKIYSENCVVDDLIWRLIIMIIYNKSIFFVNNSWQKIWTLDRYGILHLKEKEKKIMILNFFLPWL